MREEKWGQEAGIGNEAWPWADPLARAGGEGIRDREPCHALLRDTPEARCLFPQESPFILS